MPPPSPPHARSPAPPQLAATAQHRNGHAITSRKIWRFAVADAGRVADRCGKGAQLNLDSGGAAPRTPAARGLQCDTPQPCPSLPPCPGPKNRTGGHSGAPAGGVGLRAGWGIQSVDGPENRLCLGVLTSIITQQVELLCAYSGKGLRLAKRQMRICSQTGNDTECIR
jgi:hypothetical protein